MRWSVGLVLGVFCAPTTTWADVQLSSSQGRWSIGPCSSPHLGQFELGDTVSSNCSDAHDDESHSVSIHESSNIVSGPHGVDSVTLSATSDVQGTFRDEAVGYLSLDCWFDVTTETPFVLSVQPSIGGDVRGWVSVESSAGIYGCECVGSECAQSLCAGGTFPLVLTGVLRPGSVVSFRMSLRASLLQDNDTESGSARLTFSVTFGRTSQTYNWINFTGGEYAKDTHWDPRGVPTHDAQVSDTAIFGAGIYAVNAVGAKAGRFVIREADVALVGDAQVFGTTESPASLEVEGDASFQLYNGSVVRALHGAVGTGTPADPNDFAAIFIKDAATQLVLSGNLSVGQDMPGVVAVDGGFLGAADLRLGGAARGELEVSGVDADALFNDVVVGGSQGLGFLSVTDGGEVAARDVRIGANNLTDAQTGDTNTVRVTGVAPGGTPAHLTASDDILVGADGWASLFVLDSGIVEAGSSVTIGASGVADVLVRSFDPVRPAVLKAGPQLQIGEDAFGTLTIEPGGLVEATNVQLNVGGLVGAGELIIDGKGSNNPARMKVTQQLGVAGDPLKTPIAVVNGGVLTTRAVTIGNDALRTDEAAVHIGTTGGGATVPAEFNVVDPGSAPLTGGGLAVIGGAGPGRLDLADGAIARLTGGLVVGQQTDGALSVDSSGSTAGLRTTLVLSGAVELGLAGSADMAISNGALVTSSADVLVASQNISGTSEIRLLNGQGVTGERPELRMEGSALGIGVGGSAKVSVQADGLVRCARLVVGGAPAEAAGEMLVDTGGEIVCLADMLVGATGDGTGSVEVGPAGTLIVDGVLTVGGTSAGTITLTDSTSLVSAGQLTGASAFVKDQGRIEGIGTLDATVIVEPGGFVSPGLSPGTLTIDGDYEQQEGATLVIEVAGTEPGQFDVLHVTGNVTLAGQVELRFIDGFVPRSGDNVHFLRADGTITGKLTGAAVVETAAGVAPADVQWEITPEGTYRMTVTDATAPNVSTLNAPTIPDCGAGLCGAGIVPMLPVTLLGMVALSTTYRRHRGRLGSRRIFPSRERRN
jgi:hypothetical protein